MQIPLQYNVDTRFKHCHLSCRTAVDAASCYIAHAACHWSCSCSRIPTHRMLTEFQLFQDFPLPPPAVIQPATRTLSRLRVSILYILLYVERESEREREICIMSPIYVMCLHCWKVGRNLQFYDALELGRSRNVTIQSFLAFYGV